MKRVSTSLYVLASLVLASGAQAADKVPANDKIQPAVTASSPANRASGAAASNNALGTSKNAADIFGGGGGSGKSFGDGGGAGKSLGGYQTGGSGK